MDTTKKQANERVYIGKVEALEVAQERGFFELPRKGKEVLTIPSKAENLSMNRSASFCFILGKDEQGFYLAEGE